MGLRKSIVLTALLPVAIGKELVFLRGVEYFSHKGITVIEFFTPFELACNYGKILASHSLSGIYLGATYQKKNKVNLSAVAETVRAKAVADTICCVDAAISAKAEAVLVTSGSYPLDPAQEMSALSSLERSLYELLEYANSRVDVLLEPGDRTVDAYQLIGPTVQAVGLAQKIRERYPNFSLTMDTSHIAQLGEPVKEALQKSIPYCKHIHLANCILNPKSGWYGDKHPLFNCKDGIYTSSQLREVMRWAVDCYQQVDRDLTLSLEIISRVDSVWGWTEQMMKEEEWFFAG